MQPPYSKEQQRLDFEMAYARHALAYAGFSGNPTEAAATLKSQRRNNEYEQERMTLLWEGYQLAPVPTTPHPNTYTRMLDRSGLELCVQLATERLEDLNRAERTEVWCVWIDGTNYHTATSALDAMRWLASMSAAYVASPPPDGEGPLERSERSPLRIENRMAYPDELAKLLAANGQKPDAIGDF